MLCWMQAGFHVPLLIKMQPSDLDFGQRPRSRTRTISGIRVALISEKKDGVDLGI